MWKTQNNIRGSHEKFGRDNMTAVLYFLDVSSIEENDEYKRVLDILPWRDRLDDIKRQKNPKNRRLSIGAGILLYYALKNAGVKDFAIAKNGSGKPYLLDEDVSFNISHSGDAVICGVAGGKTDIGVDVEYIRKYNPAVFTRYFSDRERRWADERFGVLSDEDEIYTRLWTLKESYVKMTGTGISDKFSETDLTEADVCFQIFSMSDYRVTFCTNIEIIVDFKPITLDKICFYRYK